MMRADLVEHGASSPKAGAEGDNDERDTTRRNARRLSAHASVNDFVGRYGGEEFIVVLDLPNLSEITAVAERVRVAIEQPAHPINGQEALPITISIGCATVIPGKHNDYTELVEDADQALYAAKRAGRNRVVRAGVPPPVPVTGTVAHAAV